MNRLKIYKVQKYEADTCGNRWTEEEPLYFKAAKLQAVQDYVDKQPRFLGGFWIEEVEVVDLE